MSILGNVARYLELCPPLLPFCANGILTGRAAADVCAALRDDGIAAAATDISGRRTEAHNYTLLLRSATFLESERAALQSAMEALASYLLETASLPVLDAGNTAEELVFLGGTFADTDDSGLGTCSIRLQLLYEKERTE